MAGRATLTNEALLALGAEKLAKLVLDEAGRNAPFKKLAMAALAGAKGPAAVAAIVDRRLAGLERARGFVDWEKHTSFAADLRATLAIITGELGPADPAAAADRLVRFLGCADGVFERVDDSSGRVQDVFGDAAEALPDLAGRMPDEGKLGLVERLVPALAADRNGLLQAVFRGLIPLLPPATLRSLDGRLATAVREGGSAKGAAKHDWERIGRRDRLIRTRQAIADHLGDVDGFIALGSDRPGGRQDTIEVAERLLAAGRAAEALDWVRRPNRPGIRVMTMADLADATGGTGSTDRGRVRLEIRILTALGRKEAAQELRWRTFEANLDHEILRDYVADLPDFEEFDELARAFAHAEAHPLRYRALGFLLAWPRLDLAAKLVVAQRATWTGRHYQALAPAAEVLEHDHPVAATILYRALLDDILKTGRSPAYRQGARHLARLDDLASENLAAAGLSDHAAYRAGLRKAHGRKAGFWTLVDDAK